MLTLLLISFNVKDSNSAGLGFSVIDVVVMLVYLVILYVLYSLSFPKFLNCEFVHFTYLGPVTGKIVGFSLDCEIWM